MAFESIVTGRFSKKFSKLTHKNNTFKEQIADKMKEIRQNPDIGEPKTGELRGLRGLHITEHFVIVYLIYKDYVVFLNLDHHDKAYIEMKGVMKRLLRDERLLTSLNRVGIPTEDFALFVKSVGKK